MNPALKRADFEQALRNLWRAAHEHGDDHVDVVSGELHRLVGGYPGRGHRLPMCCGVMYALMGPGDAILQAPPKGQGASLSIRYRLPRDAAAVVVEERSAGVVAPAATSLVDAGQHSVTVSACVEERANRIGLVGCVKTKLDRAAPAGELYTSALFCGRRAYVERTCGRWFILSAKYGLVAPDEVIETYDETLKGMSVEAKRGWSSGVMDQLEEQLDSIAGLTFEIHAGEDYFGNGLRRGLTTAGATVVIPTEHMPQGRQRAFYAEANAVDGDCAEIPVAPANRPAKVVAEPRRVAPKCDDDDVLEAIVALHEAPLLVAAREWPNGFTCLDQPGLYSWFVDAAGAADLSEGLGHDLVAGRIYAGQAGATFWPSGKDSDNTLGKRIGQLHLGGKVRGSTFRHTLAAILCEQLGVQVKAPMRTTPASEKALTAWMCEHLSVAVYSHEDRDTLSSLEHAMLEQLNPPLNLSHMSPTPVRARLTELRRRINREP